MRKDPTGGSKKGVTRLFSGM